MNIDFSLVWKNIIKKQTLLLYLAIISGTFLLLFILQATIMALQNGYGVDTYATNGTFQLYNPMRRMAEGQIPGHDFPFFHGIGVLFLHFPLFTLLGENVFAAETAKHLISPLLFIITSLVFFFAYFKKISKALVATALFTLLAVPFIDVVWPGNSLVGVRSSLPVLVAASLLWNSTKRLTIFRHSIGWNDILSVLLLSLSFICGTEQGVATIIAFFLVQALITYKNSKSIIKTGIRLGVMAVGVGMGIVTLLSLLTLGHPLEPLKYGLIDIPADQGWYFGAPPNPYANWNNLIPMLTSTDLLFNHRLIYIYVLSAIAVTSVALAVKLNVIDVYKKRVFALMALTGIIVFAAGVIGGYYSPQIQLLPLHRSAGLITVALFVTCLYDKSFWTSRVKTKKSSTSRMKISYINAVTAIIFLVSAFLMINGTKDTLQIIRSYPVKDTFAFIPTARHLDDYAVSSPRWKVRLDTFKPYIRSGDTVWSLYTSLYDSSIHSLNPSSSGEDYIIHALGSERRVAYEKQFIESEPKFVITLKPTYFMYEEWLWSRHWGMYEHLLKNYTLISENDSHLLWKIADRSVTPLEKPAAISSTKRGYTLPANNTALPKIHTVSVKYHANSGLPASALAKLPRYFFTVNNTSSMRYPAVLPPTETSWTFPVVVMPGEQTVALRPVVDGLIPTATLSIQELTIQEVTTAPENNYLFINNYCSFSEQSKATHTCQAEELILKRYMDEK